MSSSCGPIAPTLPPSTTTMRSAWRTVDRRCATMSVVRSSITASIARCTMCSDSASNADVASSSSRTRGLHSSARAIATRCFCPPDSRTPRSPTVVLYPSGKSVMKSCAKAALATASTRSSAGAASGSLSCAAA
mmetsp:Transcript_93422/g.264501  ORF Transcript_93422/g.264501 Transcript_93422/m.264501 type:complete len:134 (+) Transcript_93422:179-580(+)